MHGFAHPRAAAALLGALLWASAPAAHAGWRGDMQTAGFNAETGVNEAQRGLGLARSGNTREGCSLLYQGGQKLRFAAEMVLRIYKEQKDQVTDAEYEQIRQAGLMTAQKLDATEKAHAQYCKK